jgi:hypothetical protein
MTVKWPLPPRCVSKRQPFSASSFLSSEAFMNMGHSTELWKSTEVLIIPDWLVELAKDWNPAQYRAAARLLALTPRFAAYISCLSFRYIRS